LTLHFVEAGRDLIIAGLIRVRRTFVGNAVGQIASRRHCRVHFSRTDQVLKRLRAPRLDNSHDSELCRLIGIHVLGLNVYCLRPLGAADTSNVVRL
jgi:hypothetical protein